MLCYEIWLNQKQLGLVGHRDALTLDATVSFHRSHTEQFLNVAAVAWREGTEARDCYWSTPRLAVGDEVRIKLVDADAARPPDGEMPYGVRLPPPWGSRDACCSFCGATTADRKMLFDGPSVKICDACVEFRYRIVANEQTTEV